MRSLQVQTVLYHNEKTDLIRSLESLDHAAGKGGRADIGSIVVRYGDASEAPLFTPGEIAALNGRLRHLSLEYRFFGFNSGTSRGHNILGNDCGADFMMVMNPDVILTPLFFEEIMAPFADPGVGIVEARQVPVEHHKEYDPATGETGWATMACAVFPASLFRALHGFDADLFFLYCDDVDFSWRARLEGFTIIYRPGAMVFHAKRLSADCAWRPTPAEQYYSKEAALFMAYKWSNDKRVEKLLKAWRHGSDDERRVCRKFLELRESGGLPPQLDPQGKVATFLGGYYSPNRYTL